MVSNPVHEVEHLRRVEQLLEAAQELDALVVSALGVDKDQQRTGARGGARGLPEAWRRGGGQDMTSSLQKVKQFLRVLLF